MRWKEIKDFALVVIPRAILLAVACFITAVTIVLSLVSLQSCSSKHYFSVTADEITNPDILYSDSTGVQKVW